MVGYITRDKNGLLCLHDNYPDKRTSLGYFTSDNYMELSDNDCPEFKNLKWEDEPIKVKLNFEII